MKKTITHKHLKRQFDIFEDSEDLTKLFAELQFSTLLIPASEENFNLSFPIMYMEDKRFLPVFTDIHEYNKCDVPEGFTLMDNEFGFYLDLLDGDIDGIVVDVEGARFPLTREIRDFVNYNYAFDYDPNVFTLKEMKLIRDVMDNTELEEFLKDESNHWDLDELLDLLLKSDLFEVILSREDLSDRVENGVISLFGIGPLPTAMSERGNERHALLYTSPNEVRPKANPMHPYLRLVNLPEFIREVLLNDLDGIILNENSQNITIPRDFLLNFMKDFKGPCIDKYDDYAFPLDG